LRGHVSSALHLLEAVTQLAHFVERHESGVRTEAAERKLADLVDRARVHDVTLNTLLYWADRIMQLGRRLAEELLPTYTNVQQLEVEVDDGVTLHARPVSLIVGIVTHYGTPVEMEVGGATCHAGSILELMIAVGSHPEERRFVFRGDEHPLRDIRMLFGAGLGEHGIDALPDALSYLRGD
jgi:phosphotransferase system HPr-like phosphotransfer protein